MNTKTLITLVAAATVVAAGGYGVYRLGLDHGTKISIAGTAVAAPASGGPLKPGDIDPSNGKKLLYWHDPMVPGQKFDKPGKSPFMDMDLVPFYAESGDADGGSVSISPRVQQNLGVRTADVQQGSISLGVEAVGSAAYNERDAAVVQARSNGFLERLYVRAPLDPVHRGQPLAELYVPEWVAAQEEFLSVKRIAQSDGKAFAGLVEAAQQRMRLAGMSDEQIRRVESSGTVQARVTLTAPISGVVAELIAREGMTVMAGAPLFRINGLSTIWINADVPERVAGQMRPGNPIEARVAALPGTVLKGKISAILPEVNPATRTIKARVELANPGGHLVPGMFATVNFSPAARRDVLLVPTEAVIQTGKRSVVLVAQDEGRFAPVEVEVGLDSQGRTEIRSGLQAGQKVVVSGQFLIDSEANLRASINRMGAADAATAKAGEKP
jgi:membrane fusion protein, copper/silver efflux system